jgi:Spherulation-specific family 4
VIHNPGVIPDTRFDSSTTDITVVFEESYPVYQTKVTALTDLSTKNRTEYAYMVNSVPTMTLSGLKSYVDDLSQHAAYLFVTNNDQDFYESFGSIWSNFTDVVPT